jgi:hypothetical protein
LAALEIKVSNGENPNGNGNGKPNGLSKDLYPKLQGLLLTAIFGLATWVVYTTSDHSLQFVHVTDQLTNLTDKIDGIIIAGSNRDTTLTKRNEEIDQALAKHTADINQTLSTRNEQIDSKLTDITVMQVQQGKDIADLKEFVQQIKDQKPALVIVHHADRNYTPAPIAELAPPVAPIAKVVESVVKEITGGRRRSGSGRRPGQRPRIFMGGGR